MTWSASTLETHYIETLKALFKRKVNNDGKQFTNRIILGNAVKTAAEPILPSEITILTQSLGI